MEKDEVAIKAWMIMRIDIIVCIMMIVFVLELRRGLVNRFALDFGRGDGEGSVCVFCFLSLTLTRQIHHFFHIF